VRENRDKAAKEAEFMRVIDLGWPIEENMTIFPGDRAPKIKRVCTIERDGFESREITLCTHSGTHIDAPSHLIKGAKSMDRLPPETFFGMAAAADLTSVKGREIPLSALEPFLDSARCADFILLRTDWSKKWRSPLYLEDFPYLCEDAARAIARLGLKGVGIDTISYDPIESKDLTVHKILLESGAVLIQNLKSLDLLPKELFCLAALPISLTEQDGGPARVMAVLEK
jgi:arylformamidase